MSGRFKVVMVDDSIEALMQGKILLKDFYETYTVWSAEALFDRIEDIKPDLILLDVIMPEKDGFETIRILKADERYKDIPVIFLTSDDDEESEIKGLSLGAADYITKPFSGTLLRKRILNQIELSRTARQETERGG